MLVDLDSLVGHPGAVGGVTDTAPLGPEACRRLACDGAVTRVLVTRQTTGPGAHPDDPCGHHCHDDPCGDHGHDELAGHHGCDHPDGNGHHHPDSQASLTDQLQAAARRLPPVLGGAPSQPLDVGRTTRVVQPAQRPGRARWRLCLPRL